MSLADHSSKLLTVLVLATQLLGCEEEAKKEPPAPNRARRYWRRPLRRPLRRSCGMIAPRVRVALALRLSRVWAKATRE
jgi:hypothetical protein